MAFVLLGCGGDVGGTGRQDAPAEQGDAPTNTGGRTGTARLEPDASAAGGAPEGDSGRAAGGGSDAVRDAGSGLCWFEPLGFWVRCAETWSGSPGPAFPTLTECGQRCLADNQCTSIADHTWIDGALGCVTYRSGGCTRSTGVSYNEDAAREYQKVCGTSPPPGALLELVDAPGIVLDPASPCRFDTLGEQLGCENEVPYAQATATGQTLNECLRACQSNPDCTAVQDFWGGPTTFECALHLSSCDAPVSTSTMSRFYRKSCATGR